MQKKEGTANLLKVLQKIMDSDPMLGQAFHNKGLDFREDDWIEVTEHKLIIGRGRLRESARRLEWLLVHEGWHYVLKHHDRFYGILSELYVRLRKRNPKTEGQRIFAKCAMIWNQAADLEVNEMAGRRAGAFKDRTQAGRGNYKKLPKGHTAEYYARQLVKRIR